MFYPEYAEINGKKYKIDTDYTTAIKCFEVWDDDEISDEEKIFAIVYLLFDFLPEPKDISIFFEKAIIFLQRGETTEEQNSKERDMDLVDDMNYIMASFLSDYKLDICKEKIHFWKFCDLINGLTESCVLNNVRAIRNRDLSEIKDAKERSMLAKAKREVALKEKHKKLSDKQLDSMNKFYELAGLDKD